MTPAVAETRLVRIADLHPTQITVGFGEVAQKRIRLRSEIQSQGELGLPTRAVPVVLAPDGALYLIDCHHLALAMQQEGVERAPVRQLADFSTIAVHDFWSALEGRGWCHPYDAAGRRRPYSAIPSTLVALLNDPFRSLSSALRRSGGFTKTAAPFSEFNWADFLRTRIPAQTVAMDFAGALGEAMRLARTAAAQHLPGWVADPAAVPLINLQAAGAPANR